MEHGSHYAQEGNSSKEMVLPFQGKVSLQEKSMGAEAPSFAPYL
jgi:hypothetical protein